MNLKESINAYEGNTNFQAQVIWIAAGQMEVESWEGKSVAGVAYKNSTLQLCLCTIAPISGEKVMHVGLIRDCKYQTHVSGWCCRVILNMAKGFHKHSLQGLPSVTAAANEIDKLQVLQSLDKITTTSWQSWYCIKFSGGDWLESIFHVLRIRKPSVEETAKVFRP